MLRGTDSISLLGKRLRSACLNRGGDLCLVCPANRSMWVVTPSALPDLDEIDSEVMWAEELSGKTNGQGQQANKPCFLQKAG